MHPITLSKVEATIMDMPPGKSPSPDGFTIDFSTIVGPLSKTRFGP
jgi:hypothetical protein